MEKPTTAEIFDYVKRFLLVLAGSLFVQIFVWAVCQKLEVSAGLFMVSAMVTALLYHGVQVEENTGISRISVFFAAIVTPFLISLLMNLYFILHYPNMTLYSAEADGVAKSTELLAVYAVRLTLNGAILLVFALIDRLFLRGRATARREQKNAKERHSNPS